MNKVQHKDAFLWELQAFLNPIEFKYFCMTNKRNWKFLNENENIIIQERINNLENSRRGRNIKNYLVKELEDLKTSPCFILIYGNIFTYCKFCIIEVNGKKYSIKWINSEKYKTEREGNEITIFDQYETIRELNY